jgi:hypothetical protein
MQRESCLLVKSHILAPRFHAIVNTEMKQRLTYIPANAILLLFNHNSQVSVQNNLVAATMLSAPATDVGIKIRDTSR